MRPLLAFAENSSRSLITKYWLIMISSIPILKCTVKWKPLLQCHAGCIMLELMQEDSSPQVQSATRSLYLQTTSQQSIMGETWKDALGHAWFVIIYVVLLFFKHQHGGSALETRWIVWDVMKIKNTLWAFLLNNSSRHSVVSQNCQKIFLLLDVKNNCTMSLKHLTPRLLAHHHTVIIVKAYQQCMNA